MELGKHKIVRICEVEEYKKHELNRFWIEKNMEEEEWKKKQILLSPKTKQGENRGNIYFDSLQLSIKVER